MSFQLFKCLFSLPASERLHKRNCENFSTHQNKSQHQFLLTVNHSFYCCFDVIKNILHIDVQAKKNSCCLHFRKKGVTSLHASLVQCYTEIMRWESTACLHTFDAALSAVHDTTMSHTVLYFLHIKKTLLWRLSCCDVLWKGRTLRCQTSAWQSWINGSWRVDCFKHLLFTMRNTLNQFICSLWISRTEDFKKFCATTSMFHQSLLATTLGMNCQTRAALRKPNSNSLVAKINNNQCSHWNYNFAKVHLDSKQPVRAARNLASSSGHEFTSPNKKASKQVNK